MMPNKNWLDDYKKWVANYSYKGKVPPPLEKIRTGPCDRGCYVCGYASDVNKCEKYNNTLKKEICIEHNGRKIYLNIPEHMNLDDYEEINGIRYYKDNDREVGYPTQYLIDYYFLREEENILFD